MNTAIDRFYRYAGEFARGLVYRMILQGQAKWFQREPGLVELVVLDDSENLTDEAFVALKFGTADNDVAVSMSGDFEESIG